MTNQEISQIVSTQKFYTITTDGGGKYVGFIDGPYNGFKDALLEGYEYDYLYITLINSQQQILRLFSHNIVRIEEFDI